MAKPLPRNHRSLEPTRRPKLHCIRGHLLRRLGWVLSPTTGRDGIVRHVRRCKACLRDDVDNLRGRRMRNERTSARIAKIAGKLLALKAGKQMSFYAWSDSGMLEIPWADIRALAASALTQTEDHAERKVLRSGRLPRGHRRIKRHKPVVRNGRVRK